MYNLQPNALADPNLLSYEGYKPTLGKELYLSCD